MGVGGEEGEDSCGVESGGGVREDEDDDDDGGSAIVQGILPQFWFTEGRDRQTTLAFLRLVQLTRGFPSLKDGTTKSLFDQHSLVIPWLLAFSITFQSLDVPKFGCNF